MPRNPANWSMAEYSCKGCGAAFSRPAWRPAVYCSRVCCGRAGVGRSWKLSDETKAKMSASQLGHPNRNHNPPTEKQMEGLKLGWALRIRKGRKVKNPSPRPHKRGENSPRWKGGITAKNHGERRAAMGTWEYKQWRRSVYERDNYTCQMCGARGGIELQADHIKPWATFPDSRYEISNGRTLCVPCHRRTPSYGGGALKVSQGG